MTGPYGPFYWMLIADQRVHDPAVLVPQASATTSSLLFMLSLLVNVGMWLERFVIIVTSACTATSCRRRGTCTAPTMWDFGMFTGTIGLFLSLFFLFVRLLPMISIFEVRTLVPEAKLKTAGAPRVK